MKHIFHSLWTFLTCEDAFSLPWACLGLVTSFHGLCISSPGLAFSLSTHLNCCFLCLVEFNRCLSQTGMFVLVTIHIFMWMTSVLYSISIEFCIGSGRPRKSAKWALKTYIWWLGWFSSTQNYWIGETKTHPKPPPPQLLQVLFISLHLAFLCRHSEEQGGVFFLLWTHGRAVSSQNGVLLNELNWAELLSSIWCK